MRYKGSVYRPPSEARSYLLQVTYGCTHNKCRFCSMYRDKPFQIREINEIIEDLKMARQYFQRIDRVFLCDGDALCLSNEKLIFIIKKIFEILPEVSRISMYGSPKDVLMKTDEELKELREQGVEFIYIGAESGSDKVLEFIEKGATRKEIINAVQKIEKSGIKASVTFISGLGGKKYWKEHAIETGSMISEMGASFVGVLTLLLEETAPMYKDVLDGSFEILTAQEILKESMLMIENIDTSNMKECVFRSNHASNYVSLRGNLPQDKDKFLNQLKMASENLNMIKDERFRAL